MRWLFAVCFSVTFLVVVQIASSASPTPYSAKTYDKNKVCNLIQDSQVSEAIKTLETKLENLIVLVNKLSTTPPPPGKFRESFFLLNFISNGMRFCSAAGFKLTSNLSLNFFKFTAVPLSSCKKLNDKQR